VFDISRYPYPESRFAPPKRPHSSTRLPRPSFLAPIPYSLLPIPSCGLARGLLVVYPTLASPPSLMGPGQRPPNLRMHLTERSGVCGRMFLAPSDSPDSLRWN
jgi:hypothetical protein